jgi:glycosyltransferase involved in cell wall biosynthesis
MGDARPMRAINLSNVLIEKGHRVVLWSSAFDHQRKTHRSINAKRIRVSDNLEIQLIPSRGYQKNIGISRLIDHAQLAFNLSKILQQSDTLPDVVFIGYPPIETAFVMIHWLIKRGVPSLLDVKDQWPPLFLYTFPKYLQTIGKILLWPYYHLSRLAIKDATGLSSMANEFLDWAIEIAKRKRIDMDGVFPLTSPKGRVMASQLEDARRWWDEQDISDDGRPRVCFVGSHSQSFDFKPVRDAANIAANGMTPCEFVICGDGACSSELRAMMSGLKNVYFPGWIDRPKIEALAERCIGLLAPYHNTEDFRMSLPNKIIDALSLGLPILTSLQGEVASLIVSHGVGLRYGTDTGKSLDDCIQTLVHDAVLQRHMSQNALALYSEQFSFERVYGGLVKHLEKMARTYAKHDHR